jgi:predicted 3-demethylubiquinone-9 3-methyltransferase (glyoxalase superfamily)
MKGILGHIWFQDGVDEAVELYTSLFEESSVGDRLTYTEAGQEIHGREPGSTQTVDFTIAGRQYVALNGGRM